MCFSNVSESKLILSLEKCEVESSSDSKDDEMEGELSQFSDDKEKSFGHCRYARKKSSHILMKKITILKKNHFHLIENLERKNYRMKMKRAPQMFQKQVS